MKSIILIILLIFSTCSLSWAEEVEVDQPRDPIASILFAPFILIGEIFSGVDIDYDPDEQGRYMWANNPYNNPYGSWYAWDDPYYYWGDYYFDRYRYYRPYRYPYYRGRHWRIRDRW